MRKILTERFAIIKKGGQYVKPLVDDTPYLLFKRELDAKACIALEKPNSHKIVRVRVSIQPVRS
jgi:hypothetical protein